MEILISIATHQALNFTKNVSIAGVLLIFQNYSEIFFKENPCLTAYDKAKYALGSFTSTVREKYITSNNLKNPGDFISGDFTKWSSGNFLVKLEVKNPVGDKQNTLYLKEPGSCFAESFLSYGKCSSISLKNNMILGISLF